jgi:hypothetical protein
MMVGEHGPKSFTLWALAGPITADERELVEDILDTTRIPGLLPKNPVRTGDGWTVDKDVVRGLCNMETLSLGELIAKLETVKDDKATISFKGEVEGFQQGGHAKLKIQAEATFNTKTAFVEKLVWNEQDTRASSPIAPTGTYQVKIEIVRDRSQAPNLTDQAVEGVDLNPKDDSLLIAFEAPKGQYRFLHDRSWYVTAIRNNIVVMRRIKEGEFLGQLSLALLNDKAPGTRYKPDDFQRIVEQTNSVEIEEVERTDNLKSESGVGLQRIVAKGTAGGGKVKLVHRHYLATSSAGLQLMMSFLMEPQNTAKFGNADEQIVASLQMPPVQSAGGKQEAGR